MCLLNLLRGCRRMCLHQCIAIITVQKYFLTRRYTLLLGILPSTALRKGLRMVRVRYEKWAGLIFSSFNSSRVAFGRLMGSCCCCCCDCCCCCCCDARISATGPGNPIGEELLMTYKRSLKNLCVVRLTRKSNRHEWFLCDSAGIES
jgi:hypothetical protein